MALCCKKTLAALTAALMLAAPAWAETVLKVVPHADLKVLDPVWTTAFVTRHHGYMIYDTLFGLTQKGEIKPQLVDTYTASPDNLHYSFTLREGLKFSDGTPLTTKDVIASIKRWGARDNLGAKLLAAAEKLEAKDDRTFTLDFKKPFGMVLQTVVHSAFCDAREGRSDRPLQADYRYDGLRPLHVCGRPLSSGRKGGLP